MKFTHTFASRDDYYALGVEQETGTAYLSIPLSLPRADYEEYFRLTRQMAELFLANPIAARQYADDCRDGQHRDALLYSPAEVRGTPWQP